MTGPVPVAERTGVWVHAVSREADGSDPVGIREVSVRGVGGGEVRAVRAAGLTAVVSTVDLAEFGEEPLARNLENLAWLETIARTHHRVVEAVGERGPVIPARLATIYRDDHCVAAMLTQRRAEFGSALDRVVGRTEWGVKAYVSTVDAATVETTGADVTGADVTGADVTGAGAAGAAHAHDSSPGTRYLRRRRAQLSGRDEARRAMVADAEAIHRALAGRADANRRHPPQAAGLSGRGDWMVLNGTYLVGEESGAGFAETVAALAQRYPRIELELTGPWPPYSFAEDEEATP